MSEWKLFSQEQPAIGQSIWLSEGINSIMVRVEEFSSDGVAVTFGRFSGLKVTQNMYWKQL